METSSDIVWQAVSPAANITQITAEVKMLKKTIFQIRQEQKKKMYDQNT